jgi:hypothetical protein
MEESVYQQYGGEQYRVREYDKRMRSEPISEKVSVH